MRPPPSPSPCPPRAPAARRAIVAAAGNVQVSVAFAILVGVVTFVIFGALSLGAREAAAQPGREKVGVLRFEGEEELAVRREVMRVIDGRGFPLVGAQALEESAAARGGGLDDRAGVKAVCEALAIAAILEGRVEASGARRSARIAVRRGRDGALLGEERWSVRGPTEALARAVGRSFWQRLGPAIVAASAPELEAEPAASAATAPAATATATATVEAPPAAPPPVVSPLRRAPALLDVAVGPRLFSRHFSYRSDPRGTLRDFRTKTFAPALGLTIAAFPFRNAPPAIARLGLLLGVEYGLSLESRTSDDLVYQSPARDLGAALAYRVPWRRLQIDVLAGAGRHRFPFEPRGAARQGQAAFPDVDYVYARGGLACRLATAGALDLTFGLQYRHLLSAGAIASEAWFPSLSGRGFEAQAGFAYPLFPTIEARGALDFRRYGHGMGGGMDAHVSSGAVDEFWSLTLALAFLLGSG